MSISSIGNITSLLTQYYCQINKNTNQGQTAKSSAAVDANLAGVNSINADGDTFQFSGNVPPPPPAAYTSNGSDTDAGASQGQQNAAEMFAKMDTDADGTLTEPEFIAARPDNATEKMAKNLFSTFNTDMADALTETEYTTAMANAPVPPPAGAAGSGQAGNKLSVEDMFSQLDADSDGAISESEFLAAKPDDVTTEMAQQLYNSFDADSDKSLTAEEYAGAMNNAPPPPPPPNGGNSAKAADTEYASDAVSALDTNGDGVISLEELLAAKSDDVSNELAQQVFNILDANGDGSVSASEYAEATQKSSQQYTANASGNTETIV